MRRSYWFTGAIFIVALITLTVFSLQASSFNPTKNTIVFHDLSDGNPAFAGAWFVVTGDIDGDGRADVIGGAHHSQKVSWFRNLGHGTWVETVIVSGFDGFTALAAADIDGDGDLDVVAVAENIATAAWFENPRLNDSGANGVWDRINIDTGFANPSSVVAGDMDSDGDQDVIAVRTNLTTFGSNPSTYAACPPVNGEVAWWANGAGGTAWTKTTIDANFPGVTGVAVGDLDSDGDLDVAGAAVFTGCIPGVPPTITGSVAWWANNGNTWTRIAVDNSLNNANFVTVGNLDGDADLDIIASATHLVGSFTGDVGELVWYPNLGGAFGGKNTIDAAHVGTVGITTADLDGDGDLDIAAAAPISGQVNWFANTAGNASTWSKSFIGAFPDAISVASGDLDGDGDRDVVAARGDVLNENFGEVAWWGFNRVPTIGINAGLTVVEGFSATITSAMLQPFDDDPAGRLVYTVTSLPANGTLKLNGTALALNSTFTQQDILDGSVTYTHDGSETLSDNFGFALTDGVIMTPLLSAFQFTIRPVDDAALPLVSNPGDKALVGSLTGGEVRPSILWLPAGGATPTYYHILIADANEVPALDLWFTANDVCRETPCVFTPTFNDLPAGLLNGSYTLTIQQYAGGSISDVGSPLLFTVEVPLPAAQPNAQVNTNQGRPSLVFGDDPGATWLQVWIGTKNALETVHLGWYRKLDALCNGTTCELHLDAHLLNGAYTLYFQAWGPGGFNENNLLFWNGAFDFSLSFQPPEAVQPLTPTVTNGTPTLTWQGAEGATWYQVWLGTLSPIQTYFTGWLAALDLNCGSLGICVATLNGVNLPAGNSYSWYIQGWGPGGLSTGGVADGWTAGTPFTP